MRPVRNRCQGLDRMLINQLEFMDTEVIASNTIEQSLVEVKRKRLHLIWDLASVNAYRNTCRMILIRAIQDFSPRIRKISFLHENPSLHAIVWNKITDSWQPR